MKFARLRPIVAVAALTIAACAPAMADLTITLHSSFSSPSSQASPMQGLLAQYADATEYIHGERMRMDTGGITAINDVATHKITILNNAAKTYSVVELSPETVRQMLSGGAAPSLGVGAGTNYTIIDTGKTATVLGHKVRHYITKTSMPLGQMGTLTVRQDILAAQDFPAADMAAIDSMNAMTPGPVHIKGIPLVTTTTMSGGPIGEMTIKQEATAISTHPVAASMFQIPSGYAQTQSPAAPGMPGASAIPPTQ